MENNIEQNNIEESIESIESHSGQKKAPSLEGLVTDNQLFCIRLQTEVLDD